MDTAQPYFEKALGTSSRFDSGTSSRFDRKKKEADVMAAEVELALAQCVRRKRDEAAERLSGLLKKSTGSREDRASSRSRPGSPSRAGCRDSAGHDRERPDNQRVAQDFSRGTAARGAPGKGAPVPGLSTRVTGQPRHPGRLQTLHGPPAGEEP
ncbi:MAG: hypothetical protein LBT40_03260 [Deltaproteobacteria bacterium]|nr:hypothetical protein [Deltaproteobacteria bacterium]